MTRLLKLWCVGLFSYVFALPHHLCVIPIPWQTKRERKKWPMRRYRLRRDRWLRKRAASGTDRKIPASTTYLSGIGGVESMRIDAVRDAPMCSWLFRLLVMMNERGASLVIFLATKKYFVATKYNKTGNSNGSQTETSDPPKRRV